MKVVDQKSITQRNSKPISREIQSNQQKHSKSAKKKKKKKKKKTKSRKKKEKKKQYQASAAEPQLKVATLKRS